MGKARRLLRAYHGEKNNNIVLKASENGADLWRRFLDRVPWV